MRENAGAGPTAQGNLCHASLPQCIPSVTAQTCSCLPRRAAQGQFAFPVLPHPCPAPASPGSVPFLSPAHSQPGFLTLELPSPAALPPPPSQKLPSKPPSLPVSLSPALPALPWHNQGGSFLSPCLPRCQHLLQPLSSKLWPLGRSRCRGARDALTTVSQVVHLGGCKGSRAGSGG